MYKVAYHPKYVHPLPDGHRFPMFKYELIHAQLLREGTVASDCFFEPRPIAENYILLAHEKQYWKCLKELTLSDKEIRRIGLPLSNDLVERELRIVGGTWLGCKYALKDGIAFNIAGGTHHAARSWGEGFCLLNDQAIAAAILLKEKLCHKIAIIDLDVHQGNGTAQIFENDPRVFTFSMHAENNFPFTKEKSDIDVGLENGMGDHTYLQILNDQLTKLFEDVNPDFIFYLSGVDVLATDKFGKLKLSKEGCKRRDLLVFEECKRRGVPVQVSMGGGYSFHIRDIVDAHCNTFKQANNVFG